jgi:hypothetical protein
MRSPNIMKVLAKSREIFLSTLFFSGQREGVVLVLLRKKEI